MTSIAIFKWAMNPHDERIGANGAIKWLANRPEIGDDDYLAVQVAKDADPNGEVVGLTMASGDTAFAAARGAERTITVEGLDAFAQPTQVAAALANAVREVDGASLVTIGDSAWSPMTPSLLAAYLGWPCLLAVDSVVPEDDALVVTRRYGTGTQSVRVSGPIVLGVAARREEAEKPGMRTVLQARKKPVGKTQAATEGSPQLTVSGIHEPDARPSKVFDGADASAAAAQLVAALKSEGVL